MAFAGSDPCFTATLAHNSGKNDKDTACDEEDSNVLTGLFPSRRGIGHDQGPDGRKPLLDEDAAEGRRRDGAARFCLQSHPGHEHHGRPAARGGDAGTVELDNDRGLAPHSDHYAPYIRAF